MKLTSSQGLPYPEIDDFANGALDLQYLAEKIDSKLAALNAKYDQIGSPEVLMIKGSADITGFTSGVVNDILITGDQSYNPLGFSSNTPITFRGMRPGTYIGGAYIRSIPAGAANLNSYRTLVLRFDDFKIPGSGFTRYREEWQNEVYESGTGEENQTMEIAFALHDPDNAMLAFTFAHINTSSTVTIKSDSYVWVARTGDLGV